MDIDKFLEQRPAWANEPCLYIVRQMATENPNAHRCGASGTHLFSGADLPYGSERATTTGLNSRLNMYSNFWLPVKGKIFAALRVKRALVAEVDTDRLGEDFAGGVYNIDRGGHTLVLTREKEFHAALDRRGLRWQTDKRNELFVPRRNTQELIAALRTIRGEELFLCFPDGTILEDEGYRGGSRHSQVNISIRDTVSRQVPDRVARVPSLTIRLSRDSLEQLRSANPQQFSRLLAIVRSFDEHERTKREQAPDTVHVRMSAADIEKLRARVKTEDEPVVRGVEKLPPRRSARIAGRRAV